MCIYALARYHAVVTLAHVQLNPFYHPSYPDITHVRKDTRPSSAFTYCKQRKAECGLGKRLGSMVYTNAEFYDVHKKDYQKYLSLHEFIVVALMLLSLDLFHGLTFKVDHYAVAVLVM